MPEKTKAIFLDRDGVLNKEMGDYVCSVDDFHILDNFKALKTLQDKGDFTEKMVLMEEAKTLPFDDIWAYYCETQGVPADESWFNAVQAYEKEVLSKRG